MRGDLFTPLNCLEPEVRIELTTYALQKHCSTIELLWQDLTGQAKALLPACRQAGTDCLPRNCRRRFYGELRWQKMAGQAKLRWPDDDYSASSPSDCFLALRNPLISSNFFFTPSSSGRFFNTRRKQARALL